MDLDELRGRSDPEDGTPIVVCLGWGYRSVASVRVNCAVCGKALAMSKVVRKELPDAEAVCTSCAHKAAPDIEPEATPAVRRQVAAYTGQDVGARPGISLNDFIKRMGPL